MEKEQPELHQTRFIAIDTETTGLNYKEDRILSIGAVSIKNNIIDVSNSFEVYIKQEKFNPETVEIHGIIKNEKFKTLSEAETIEQFLSFIGNAVLVAHHAQFDMNMLNLALKRNGLPKLKNKVLDTMILYRATRITSNLIDHHKNYSLDEVAEALSLDLKDRHTAAGDAFITALAFLKITSKLNKGGKLKLKDLFRLR